jgi:hypothetical protein
MSNRIVVTKVVFDNITGWTTASPLLWNNTKTMTQQTAAVSGETAAKSQLQQEEAVFDIKVLEQMNHFCIPWDAMNLDSWWTQRIDFVVDTQTTNTTHQCFRRDSQSKRALFLQRIHANQYPKKQKYRSCQVDNVHIRYLWSSGWGECNFFVCVETLHYELCFSLRSRSTIQQELISII